MKKKIFIPLITAFVLFAVLFVPVPQGIQKDGGTREYTALTYKIISWKKLTDDGTYEKLRVYFGRDRKKSAEELWLGEAENIEHSFLATVLSINENLVFVEPLEDETERQSCNIISIDIQNLEKINARKDSTVKITYTGCITETSPASVKAKSWALSDDLRHLSFNEQWLDKETAEKYDHDLFEHIRITKIYSDCFFAKPVIALPYEIKLNGTLSDEWCVGDQITCTYENTYYDKKNHRVEADMLTITQSDWQPDPNAAYKPVIYLYPEEETDVEVKLTLNGILTCTYPLYNDGWSVTASPDGTLKDKKGQTYNYLYWEGETYTDYDLSEGFCIKGEDTAAFLEEALKKAGLNRREANEFIVYWLPLMEKNPYNIISFQKESYTSAADLRISPEPDTLIRVFMTFKNSDKFVELPPQTLSTPERKGFTVVEWGGTEIF